MKTIKKTVIVKTIDGKVVRQHDVLDKRIYFDDRDYAKHINELRDEVTKLRRQVEIAKEYGISERDLCVDCEAAVGKNHGKYCPAHSDVDYIYDELREGR